MAYLLTFLILTIIPLILYQEHLLCISWREGWMCAMCWLLHFSRANTPIMVL